MKKKWKKCNKVKERNTQSASYKNMPPQTLFSNQCGNVPQQQYRKMTAQTSANEHFLSTCLADKDAKLYRIYFENSKGPRMYIIPTSLASFSFTYFHFIWEGKREGGGEREMRQIFNLPTTSSQAETRGQTKSLRRPNTWATIYS